jgi:hypothetical protein
MEEKMVVQGPSWLREAALKLLPTLDLNTATQSSISQQLQAQLGCDLTIHKDFLGVRFLSSPTMRRTQTRQRPKVPTQHHPASQI